VDASSSDTNVPLTRQLSLVPFVPFVPFNTVQFGSNTVVSGGLAPLAASVTLVELVPLVVTLLTLSTGDVGMTSRQNGTRSPVVNAVPLSVR